MLTFRGEPKGKKRTLLFFLIKKSLIPRIVRLSFNRQITTNSRLLLVRFFFQKRSEPKKPKATKASKKRETISKEKRVQSIEEERTDEKERRKEGRKKTNEYQNETSPDFLLSSFAHLSTCKRKNEIKKRENKCPKRRTAIDQSGGQDVDELTTTLFAGSFRCGGRARTFFCFNASIVVPFGRRRRRIERTVVVRLRIELGQR